MAAGGIRVLELYCGIGGLAAALPSEATVTAAVDINRIALEVYRHNFPHPTVPALVESLSATHLARLGADLWWLSPPCQPFTRRGRRRDLDDRRTAGLLALVPRIDRVRPPYLALENVPGFAGSRTHARLRRALDGAGYEVREQLLCPSQLGLPNRRRRFYLVASRQGLAPPLAPLPAPARPRVPLEACLDPEPPAAPPGPESLWLARETAARYRHALDVVDARDPTAVTACFTAAYGRSPVRSGSYLIGLAGVAGGGDRRLRRFSPREILRLLGFPATYSLPPGLRLENAFRLLGNSLSVPPVRRALAGLPAFATLGAPLSPPLCSGPPGDRAASP